LPLIVLFLILAVVPAWMTWRRREQETAARTLARKEQAA
jgi:type II secretory pathway pseudopilin PulG